MPSPRLSHVRAGLLALALVLPLGAASAQQKIEQQMSHEQFKSAGLDKLTPQELANLNAWLQGTLEVETAKAAEVAKQESTTEDRRGLFTREVREPVTATLTGGFDGLAKGREFTLDNGQVWRQTDDASLTGVRLDKPQVKITPGLVGNTWYLSVEGYNTRARVQRVK